MRGPLADPQPPPPRDSGQGAGLQVQRGLRQTDRANIGPGLHLQSDIPIASRLTMTHFSVQPEQGHVVCWLRLQEAVIAESEDIGEVRMEEDLGGVIPLDGVVLGET